MNFMSVVACRIRTIGRQASMGGKATDDRYGMQESRRGRARDCRPITGRGRRLPVIAALIAVAAAVAGCSSSSSSNAYSAAAATTYPSYSVADLFRSARDSSPPVQAAGPPAVANSSTAVAATAAAGPTGPAISGSATAVAAVPARSAPADDYDQAAASVYPSQPLFDFSNHAQDSRPSAQAANAPAAMNSSAAAAAAPAPSSPSDKYDAAASAYPSQPLTDLIFGSTRASPTDHP